MRLWTGVSRRPANLMPENRIFSVPGSFEDSIQFDPGLVCIQRIIGDGQGIGVINLTPPKLNDSISGKSIQVMLDHRVPGYIMTSVQPDLPPCVTAINQTPQDSCLDAKSHGTVSMGCHKPEVVWSRGISWCGIHGMSQAQVFDLRKRGIRTFGSYGSFVL